MLELCMNVIRAGFSVVAPSASVDALPTPKLFDVCEPCRAPPPLLGRPPKVSLQ